MENLESKANSDKTEVKTKPNNLRLEKLKMPYFDGDLREYPRFKRDFEKKVQPSLTADTAPYTLRSCLGKEPLSAVKSLDDNIDEMWKRLDEKYGDPARVADAIMDCIRKVRPVKEGDNKRFIDFIDVVENGYRDLARIGLEKEITTTSSVSIIERKLPGDVRKEWTKLITSESGGKNEVKKIDKFPSFLEFLLSQKRAIEYDTDELRASNISSVRSMVHYAEAEETEDKRRPQQTFTKVTYDKCLFHEHGGHTTSDCRFYLSKTPNERRNMLKERGACWSCLRRGHRSRECRKRIACDENGCTRRHHKTIHDKQQEISVSTFII